MIWEPVLAKFKELFGDEGEIGVYFAPGRVNMIGDAMSLWLVNHRLRIWLCIPITTEDMYFHVRSRSVPTVWREKETTRSFAFIP